MRRLSSGAIPAVIAFGVVATFALMTALLRVLDHSSYDIGGALLVAPVLVAISVPFVTWAAKEDFAFRSMLYTSLAVKALFTVVRYIVIFNVYGGNADASRYHEVGAGLVSKWRHGSISFGGVLPIARGTPFIERLTATVYSVIGPSKFGGFLVFSWFSWMGLVLFAKAMDVGYPGADSRRYRLGVLFLPSLLFWPSSLGKEAWMVFMLGLGSYGVARLLNHRIGGATITAAGLVGAGAVRSHVSAVVVAALAGAFIVRSRRGDDVVFGSVLNVLGMVGIVVVLSFAVSRAGSELGGESQNQVGSILNRTAAQTLEGGSTFESVRANSPAQYPLALFTVLFRPTLLEVRNATQLQAAAETTLLAIIACRSWRRLVRLPRVMLSNSYLLFATLYVAIFCFAWSSIGNFGILARQRTQVLPFLLLLFAVPKQPEQLEQPHESPRPTIRPVPRPSSSPESAIARPSRL